MSASAGDIPLRVQGRPPSYPSQPVAQHADRDRNGSSISEFSSSIFSFDIDDDGGTAEADSGAPGGSDGRTLERRLGLWSGIGIVMGSIIGSGVFSTPALILDSVGSIGMSLVVWVIGALVSVCGCAAYMELGTMLPRGGGEKAYLDAAFPRPRAFLAFVFCLSSIFVCWPTGLAADAVVTGSYLLYAANGRDAEPPAWAERLIGLSVAGLCALAHACFPRTALRVQSALTAVKALLLVLVVAVGVWHMGSFPAGAGLFAGTSRNPSAYAAALFKVFFAYSGYTALNYAADELRNPERTLPRAALGGLLLTAMLYVLSNIAYFAVLDADAVRQAGTTVAGVFFSRTLGSIWGQRVVPVLIALATLGNVMCGTFAASRVIFAAARDGYLPMARLWGSVSSRFQTPLCALAAGCALVSLCIVVPPPGQAYALLIDTGGYATWVFSGLAVVGLLRMRVTHRGLARPFRAWMPANVLSVAAALFMCVVPFVRPSDASSRTVPYWTAPVASLAFIVLSMVLWYVQIVVRRGLERAQYAKQQTEG
ncbi:hypothetical protein GGI07_005251 [Coemansia sp. Benny D115]|nr:hypothetical protein GGI07_005251 [Coemansia sp. Benny D115]